MPTILAKQCWFLGEVYEVMENFSCAIMPNVPGTDQHCFKGKGGAFKA